MKYQKDWLPIANRALLKVGNTRLLSLDEGSDTASLVNDLLRGSVEEIAGLYPWRSMMKRRELSVAQTAPEYGFDYQYSLPENLARVVKVTTLNDEEWKIEGSVILTDSKKVYLEYVDLPETPASLTPELRQLIVLRLAWNINNTLTTNTTLGNLLLNEFNVALNLAKNNDPAGEEDITEFTSWNDKR